MSGMAEGGESNSIPARESGDIKPRSSDQLVAFRYNPQHTKYRMSRQGATLEIYEKYDKPVKWKLLQYVSPTGRRAIDDWRNGLTLTGKVDFDVFLRNLLKKRVWLYPDVRSLTGKPLKGLWELRWKSDHGVPHRVGGYFASSDEFVMLIGWRHNQKKYDPPDALESLQKRMNRLKTGEATLCEYQILNGRSASR